MELHQIQKHILFDLLFSETLKYSEVKPWDMDPTQFNFHLKKLISLNFIEKTSDGHYKLTNIGKEVANRLNTETIEFSQQAKITTVICCSRSNDNTNNIEYLIYRRLKNPHFNAQGFPTQKVLWGQNIMETVIKGLKEETNLDASMPPKLFAIRHYQLYNDKGLLLEDKLMHAFLFINPTGTLQSSSEGDFSWVGDKDATTLPNPLTEFPELLIAMKQFILDDKLTFKEFQINIDQF